METTKYEKKFSVTRLSSELTLQDNLAKYELSKMSPTYYVHFRENEAVLKETSQPSPKTRHVKKLGRRKVSEVSSQKKRLSLSQPMEAEIDGKFRSEQEFDASELRAFQKYLESRSQIVQKHTQSNPLENIDTGLNSNPNWVYLVSRKSV